MDRDLYDFTTPPDTPKEAHKTLYYFPLAEKPSGRAQSRAPAHNKLPCMAVHYDTCENVLFTRFIFKDGTWRDDYSLLKENPSMAAHYDIYGKLLFTRFIFSDGTYRDEKNHG